MKYLDKLQPLALLVMRLALAAIVLVHGGQKIFGGMPQHISTVAKIGLPGWMAYLSAWAEFGGGILVLLGLLTRVGALLITIDLAVAILKVHAKNGLRGPGGFEFPMAVAVIAFALIFFGGGPISLDWVFGGRSETRR